MWSSWDVDYITCPNSHGHIATKEPELKYDTVLSQCPFLEASVSWVGGRATGKKCLCEWKSLADFPPSHHSGGNECGCPQSLWRQKDIVREEPVGIKRFAWCSFCWCPDWLLSSCWKTGWCVDESLAHVCSPEDVRLPSATSRWWQEWEAWSWLFTGIQLEVCSHLLQCQPGYRWL